MLHKDKRFFKYDESSFLLFNLKFNYLYKLNMLTISIRYYDKSLKNKIK